MEETSKEITTILAGAGVEFKPELSNAEVNYTGANKLQPEANTAVIDKMKELTQER